MLNQRIDICSATPPFLLSIPGNVWHLVITIEKSQQDKYICHCISHEGDNFNTYIHELQEPPFHVAENIWELSYGVEIMTLMDSSLSDHPARKLWQQWKQYKTQ